MGAYKYVNELWRKKASEVANYLQRVRCWEYRQLPSIVRLQHPTRPEKAHRVGYKAKKGYVIYRVRVRRGGRIRQCKHKIWYGKPRNIGVVGFKYNRQLRVHAEQRVGKAIGAMRVLNSYWVAQDGNYKWFDVVMVDPMHPTIRNDARINWICDGTQKHRECRGLTSAERQARGLRNKGVGAMKLRGSKQHHWRKTHTTQLHRYR
uniref:Ribosomal protein L15 n=1 Tax=Trepomonas sp. PC1 TaxID=1076344 RepID=A0A146KH53_9EUKA|eukprot:JAP94786.1 Ribosomal protein L15 [Trepomonas sp. PC1]